MYRHSLRKRDYDYSSAAHYFVTLCTKGMKHFFGEVANNQINTTSIGKIASRCWSEIPDHFATVTLDTFVIMPNHLHGIIILNKTQSGAACCAPTRLGTVIRSFKAAVSKQASMQIWQRNFYDHIIRNEKSLNTIRLYIDTNPILWKYDPDNAESELVLDVQQLFPKAEDLQLVRDYLEYRRLKRRY